MVPPRSGLVQGYFVVTEDLCLGSSKERRLFCPVSTQLLSGKFAFVPASEPTPSRSATAKKRKADDYLFSPDLDPTSSSFKVVDLARRLSLGICITAGTVFSLSWRNSLIVSCETEAEHVAVVRLLKRSGLQFRSS